MVSNKVGDSEISFVANCGDYRDCRAANCARYLLGVESPKIFSRSTASDDNQNINSIFFASIADCTFDRRSDGT